MNKELLKQNYTNACNDYLRAFLEKHNFPIELSNNFWVGDEIGGIANAGDFTFDMATIIVDIEEEAPEEELLRWYDYTLDALEFGLPVPNFKSWLHGCPRTSDETFKELRKTKSILEELCEIERNKQL